MNTNQLTVYAALMTPVDDRGQINLDALSELIDFVTDRGVCGVVVGGATGEYPSFSLEQRKQLVKETKIRLEGRGAFLTGIGCPTLEATLSLGQLAVEEGCSGVLLSMPSFFRYRQDDLEEYSRFVSRELEVPSYLYHLPAFTNSLDIDRIAELLVSEPSLAGIKDSSGDPKNLSVLTKARRRRGFKAFVGNDSRVYDGLDEGWDGAISGLACFVPELLVELLNRFRAGDREGAKNVQAIVDELIVQVEKLPIPWAIRIGLEERGLHPGPLPLPLSTERRQDVKAFRTWCRDWLDRQYWVQPVASSSLAGLSGKS